MFHGIIAAIPFLQDGSPVDWALPFDFTNKHRENVNQFLETEFRLAITAITVRNIEE